MIRTPSPRTPPGTRRAGSVLVGALVGAALLLAGCVSERAVDVAAAPAVPSSPPGAAEPAPSTAAPPVLGAALPLDCPGLLGEDEVAEAVGRPVPGRGRDVLGGPDPQIRRVERLTCSYGSTDAAGAAGRVPVEISVSRYETPDAAEARVAATVTAETAVGATAERVVVGATTGTVLRSPDTRLLVATTSDRSVAVSLAGDVVDEARVVPVLTDLAARVVAALG